MNKFLFTYLKGTVLIFVFFFAATTYAGGDISGKNNLCTLPDIQTDQRPDPEGPPTKVTMGVRMFDLSEINDVKQTLTGDFIVGLTWTDPRLSHFAGCQAPLSRVWSPQLDFFNSGRLFKRLPDHVDIGTNGRVRYIQRYSGSLASYHNLKAFPFDAQKFHIWISSLEYDENEVQLVVDEKITGRRKLLNISDWAIEGVRGSIDRTFAEGLGRYHSMYVFEISAKRETGFYLWKVILPLCLIVFMSWAVFWISPAQFGPQIGLSATSMLTLIAFQFATANILPKISYFTILDKFITGSTILVFLALLESLSTTFLVASEHAKLALRIDNVCRIAFPLTFVIMVAFIFFR